ncbi:hypothetical protein GCM10011289_09810 [Paludibacterium paludis]|uniref:Uncharacterized protein n=1 Tax=Paludibacterium paludis TaxID=1225769 RepID=A0A918P035_9NEIS|nr:hypothetical protein GCM10011289_09810 [Paludibacterium paludis]
MFYAKSILEIAGPLELSEPGLRQSVAFSPTPCWRSGRFSGTEKRFAQQLALIESAFGKSFI